jgi:hypothetical protein
MSNSFAELVTEVQKVACKEVERSNMTHRQMHYSYHESAAIIKEELDEFNEAFDLLRKALAVGWDLGVKKDDLSVIDKQLKLAYNEASMAAAEMIQVTGCCLTALDSLRHNYKVPVEDEDVGGDK